MKFIATKEFYKDLKKISSLSLNKKINLVLSQISLADDLLGISNLKPLVGHHNYFRIKFDYHYRIGCYFDGELLELKRLLSREGFYKHFP